MSTRCGFKVLQGKKVLILVRSRYQNNPSYSLFCQDHAIVIYCHRGYREYSMVRFNIIRVVYIQIICLLKSNPYYNHFRRRQFHRYVRQFLPRGHGGFGHKNQKMSDILGIAQKVRHFLIFVPKTAVISWQKQSNTFMVLGAPNGFLLETPLQCSEPPPPSSVRASFFLFELEILAR